MRLSTLVMLLVIIAGALAYAWRKGYLETAMDKANKSFSVHYTEGQSLYLAARYEEAILEFDKAVELEPKNPEAPTALARMGDCYKALKQNAKAIEMYDRVLNEFPDYKMREMVQQSREKLQVLP